jgi:predicted dehydrogenase
METANAAPTPKKILRAAVIGVGHLGQHHARNYAQNPRCRLHWVVDTDLARATRIAKEYGAKATADYRDVLGNVDCASIVTPTVTHFEIARDCLEAGIHCLVEKPICSSVLDAAKLSIEAGRRQLILQVGHIEHFNVAVQRFFDLLTTPRFIECHRLGPFNPRIKDVGVVMDLMIHDIDIIMRIVKAPILSIDAVGVNIVTDMEDIANARITFANGCIANITASRVTPKPLRKLRVFQDDAYISLDYQNQSMEVYKRLPNPDFQKAGDPRYIIESRKMRIKREEPLKLELDHFLDCVERGRPPMTGGVEAMEALDVVIKITEMVRQRASSLAPELVGARTAAPKA